MEPKKTLILYDFEGKDVTSVIQSYFANPQDFKPEITEHYNFWYNLYAYQLAIHHLELLPYSAYMLIKDNIQNNTDFVNKYKKIYIIKSSSGFNDLPNTVYIQKPKVEQNTVAGEFALLDDIVINEGLVDKDTYKSIAKDTLKTELLDTIVQYSILSLLASKINYESMIEIRMGIIMYTVYGLYKDHKLVNLDAKTIIDTYNITSPIKSNILNLDANYKARLVDALHDLYAPTNSNPYNSLAYELLLNIYQQ